MKLKNIFFIILVAFSFLKADNSNLSLEELWNVNLNFPIENYDESITLGIRVEKDNGSSIDVVFNDFKVSSDGTFIIPSKSTFSYKLSSGINQGSLLSTSLQQDSLSYQNGILSIKLGNLISEYEIDNQFTSNNTFKTTIISNEINFATNNFISIDLYNEWSIPNYNFLNASAIELTLSIGNNYTDTIQSLIDALISTKHICYTENIPIDNLDTLNVYVPSIMIDTYPYINIGSYTNTSNEYYLNFSEFTANDYIEEILQHENNFSAIKSQEDITNKSIVTAQTINNEVQYYLTTINSDQSFYRVELENLSLTLLNLSDDNISSTISSQVNSLSDGWCGDFIVDSENSFTINSKDSADSIFKSFYGTFEPMNGNLSIDDYSSKVVWFGDAIFLSNIINCYVGDISKGTKALEDNVPPTIPLSRIISTQNNTFEDHISLGNNEIIFNGTEENTTVTVNLLSDAQNDNIQSNYTISSNEPLIIPIDINNGYILNTSPTNGNVSINSQSIIYTPNNGYYGMDSFTITNKASICDTQSQTISVEVKNQLLIKNRRWYFITLPTTDTMDFPKSVVLWGYNTETSKWQIYTEINYNLDEMDIETLESTTTANGYWIYSYDDFNLSYENTSIENFSPDNLNIGWNLKGTYTKITDFSNYTNDTPVLWIYEDNIWKYFSPDNSMSNTSYSTFESIPAKGAVWIYALKENTPPIASFNISPNKSFYYLNEEITYTSTSYDLDEEDQIYLNWNFSSLNTNTLTNSYNNAGEYTISLTTTDAKGASDSVAKSITVIDEIQKPDLSSLLSTSKTYAFSDEDSETRYTVTSNNGNDLSVNSNISTYVNNLNDSINESYDMLMEWTGKGYEGIIDKSNFTLYSGNINGISYSINVSKYREFNYINCFSKEIQYKSYVMWYESLSGATNAIYYYFSENGNTYTVTADEYDALLLNFETNYQNLSLYNKTAIPFDLKQQVFLDLGF